MRHGFTTLTKKEGHSKGWNNLGFNLENVLQPMRAVIPVPMHLCLASYANTLEITVGSIYMETFIARYRIDLSPFLKSSSCTLSVSTWRFLRGNLYDCVAIGVVSSFTSSLWQELRREICARGHSTVSRLSQRG